MLRRISIGVLSAGALLAARPAFAETTDPVKSQIRELQQQIQQQQEMLKKQQEMLDHLVDAEKESQTRADKAQAAADTANAQVQAIAAADLRPATSPGPTITMSPRNRPGWRSADGRNQIELQSLMQFDFGLNDYHPASAATTPQKIQSGFNARRMQIGFNATFQEDWHAELAYDFGNSDETIAASGGPTAGFKKALVSYTGFRPFSTRTSIEMGYETPPIFLDEALGSSSGIFLEHPTPDRLATGFASGEGRAVFGVRDYTDRFFGVFMVTGPKAGDDHTAASNEEQIALVGRYTYNLWQSGANLFHLGAGFQRVLQPTFKSGSTFNALSLSDEAELRVDPTNIISVGFGSAKNPVRSGGTYSAEFAAAYGPFLAIGEYYRYDVERQGLQDVNFQGAYGEVTWSLTGERHNYVPSAGGFANLSPANPISLSWGNFGALEVAARYSWVNMNDHFIGGGPNSTSAIAGGVDQSLTLGMNWYANNNVKFMLNYIHGFLDRGSLTAPYPETGGSWNEIALRTQFGF